MSDKFKRVVSSTEFITVIGMVVIPIISFVFIIASPESPLYTSISRIAWIHGRWASTFLWATLVMGTILWLTYKMVNTGPLSDKRKRIFLFCQVLNTIFVFTGCIAFPAKADIETIVFINYLHDYMTVIGWIMYIVGLIAYSIMIGRTHRFLGFIGVCIMTFIVCSSLFFIRRVIDPSSYVGASAVSEVYIINSLLIYLVVMCILEELEVKTRISH